MWSKPGAPEGRAVCEATILRVLLKEGIYKVRWTRYVKCYSGSLQGCSIWSFISGFPLEMLIGTSVSNRLDLGRLIFHHCWQPCQSDHHSGFKRTGPLGQTAEKNRSQLGMNPSLYLTKDFERSMEIRKVYRALSLLIVSLYLANTLERVFLAEKVVVLRESHYF